MTASQTAPGASDRSRATRRIALGLGGVVVLALVLGLGLYGLFQIRFHPAPPSAAPKVADAGEGRLRDLDSLAHVVDVDRSFGEEARKDFLARIESLKAEARDMAPVRFELEVAAALALADNPDTGVVAAARWRRLNRLPVRFATFMDGVYITKTTAAHTDLLGLQVLAIGRVPIAEVLARFEAFQGGPAPLKRYIALDLAHSPQALQDRGLSLSGEKAELVVLHEGRPEALTVDALPPVGEGVADYRPWMDLVPGLKPGREEEDWRGLAPDPDKVAAAMATPIEPVAIRKLDRPSAVYVGLGPTLPEDKEFTARLEVALATLREATPHHLILDLRRVTTGSTTAIAGFLAKLPELLPDGAAFILTAPSTGTPGLRIAAEVKAALGERAMIMGEEAGQRGRFWSDTGKPLVLTNSGIVIGLAAALHDYENGCSSFGACYWPEIRKPIKAGDLKPEVTFIQRFTDHAAGRDTANEMIKALIGLPSE